MERNKQSCHSHSFSSNGKYFPRHWKWRKGPICNDNRQGEVPRRGLGSAFYEPLSELGTGKRNQVCAAPSSRRGKWKGRSCFCFRGTGTVRPWKPGGTCSGSRCFVSCRGASLHHLFLTKVPVSKIIHKAPPKLLWSWISVLYNLQPKKVSGWNVQINNYPIIQDITGLS